MSTLSLDAESLCADLAVGVRRLLRPGGVISGPPLMTLADSAAYALVLAHVGEAMQTLDAIARAKQQLVDAGKPFVDVEVGAMIEVPAVALVSKLIVP